MFTSGTTGRPKGVDISQANYAFAGQVMATASGLTPDDRQLVVLPLFHANAQYYSFASAIAVGASVALMSTFSATRFLQQAKTYAATHASLFAAPIRMILARGNAPVPGLVLKHCWYAMNIAEHQYAELAELLSCQPRQLYGMTETIPAVLTDEEAAPRPDCMGYVSPGCILDVQDGEGRSVAVGEIGEIVVGGTPVAGDQFMVRPTARAVVTAASAAACWSLAAASSGFWRAANASNSLTRAVTAAAEGVATGASLSGWSALKPSNTARLPRLPSALFSD
jgi:crotonobetaine/carnitine-CoA ligase